MIDLSIFQESLGKGLEGGEPSLTQHVRDSSVEPLDHPIGLRVTRFDQLMVNALSAADLIKGMPPCWLPLSCGTQPIGTLFPVIREHLLDEEWGLLEETGQERPRNFGRPLRVDFQRDPPGGLIAANRYPVLL